MGRVIGAIAFVIVVALIIWLIRFWLKRNERLEDKAAGRPLRGDLNARQEAELVARNAHPAVIMTNLLRGTQVFDPWDPVEATVIPESHQADIKEWLNTQKKNWKASS